MAPDDIERFLQDGSGEDALLTGEPGICHPSAHAFFNESPDPDFSGFTSAPLYEANLLLSESSDDRKWRIERDGELLVLSTLDADNAGAIYLVGEVLECAPGSNEEKAFIRNALLQCMQDAAGPLISAIRQANDSGLGLSSQDRESVIHLLFGDVAG